MAYKIKEIYYSFQGEGAQTGRPSIFCRFSGCNLWSGREEDRHKAICKFCDTDFWGIDGENGGKYTASELREQLDQLWPEGEAYKYVIMTGGEPALQLDAELIRELKDHNYEIAIETNGTKVLPDGIDWICLSPKANTEIVVKSGQELKLVYPQAGLSPSDFLDYDFEHFALQPMDGPDQQANIDKTIDYCLHNPKWRLSLQTHKFVGAK